MRVVVVDLCGQSPGGAIRDVSPLQAIPDDRLNEAELRVKRACERVMGVNVEVCALPRIVRGGRWSADPFDLFLQSPYLLAKALVTAFLGGVELVVIVYSAARQGGVDTIMSYVTSSSYWEREGVSSIYRERLVVACMGAAADDQTLVEELQSRFK